MNIRTLLIIALASLAACEADLQVHTDDFTATPVIYFLINPIDSIHTIRLSKSFDSSVHPDLNRNSKEALTYDNVSMTVRLISNMGDTIIKYPQKSEGNIKDSGYFGNNTHDLYTFTQSMTVNYISRFKKVELDIDIPGLPPARGQTDILVLPRIRFPYIHAQYLFVDPTRPILVQWYGAAWNEVDIKFDIIEVLHDTVLTQSFEFEESNNILMKEGVCEITFPYDLITQAILKTLDPHKQVKWRYFGPIHLQVHTGNSDFAFYMDTRDGINDFTGQTISNLENAIGFVGCKLSYQFKPLYFDYFTRKRFEEDPELAQYKFKEF
jgi:hypothetical protein